jgi:hypothetical protein
MRYKRVRHEGIEFGLKKGQTVEQLAAYLPEYLAIKALVDSCFPKSSDVKDVYLILTDYGLVDRSKIRRSHHKPKVSNGVKPRLGPGSGRAGGARAATHYRSHVGGGWVPTGTKPSDCYICQCGLEKAIRIQCDCDEDDVPRRKTTTAIVELRISSNDSRDVEL